MSGPSCARLPVGRAGGIVQVRLTFSPLRIGAQIRRRLRQIQRRRLRRPNGGARREHQRHTPSQQKLRLERLMRKKTDYRQRGGLMSVFTSETSSSLSGSELETELAQSKDLYAILSDSHGSRDRLSTCGRAADLTPPTPSLPRETPCVCWSTSSALGLRRHQRHVMKRRQQNPAIHRVKMHEALQFEIHRVVRLRAILGRPGRTDIPPGIPAASHATASPQSAIALATPASSARPSGSCGQRLLW